MCVLCVFFTMSREIHIDKLIDSSDFFRELVSSNRKDFCLFFSHDDGCDSLMGEIEFGNNTIKISNIVIQSETSGSHDVCWSKRNGGHVLIDSNNFSIIQDCFLEDKYDDGFDFWFSALMRMFFYDFD